ncbi:MAG: GNAT family N-acetyltransferase [Pyrobaculum sp.]
MEFVRDVEKALEIIAAYYQGSTKYAEAVVKKWPSSDAVVVYINGDVAAAELFYTLRLATSVCVHYYIAVAPSFRGRGVATRLVTYIENICNSSVYIATTRVDNLPAVKLFTKLGYSKYQWKSIPRKIREILLKSTCGYDDDFIFIKRATPQEIALYTEEVEAFWRETCLKPYLGNPNDRARHI